MVLALAVVALFEVLTLLQGVGSTRRLQARITHDVDQAVVAARPQLMARLAQGDRRALEDAATMALDRGLATEAEVIDAEGTSLIARPAPPPVSHALRPDERERVAAGQPLTVIAGDGSSLRVLAYVGFVHEGRGLLLRLATAAPDLEEELRERRQVVLGHGAALAALLVASGSGSPAAPAGRPGPLAGRSARVRRGDGAPPGPRRGDDRSPRGGARAARGDDAGARGPGKGR